MQYCSICSALYVSRLAALCWADGNDRPGTADRRPKGRSMCSRLQGEARGMCKAFHAWLEWHASMLEQRVFSRVGCRDLCHRPRRQARVPPFTLHYWLGPRGTTGQDTGRTMIVGVLLSQICSGGRTVTCGSGGLEVWRGEICRDNLAVWSPHRAPRYIHKYVMPHTKLCP